MAKSYRVTLKKGMIGCTKTQRATLEALGLVKRGKSVVITDNPANRGQVMKVQHLVEVRLEK